MINVRKSHFLKTLDLDIENRPLSYKGLDYTSAEITAIAAGWVDKEKVYCWTLTPENNAVVLEGFLDLYNEADMITGHFLRGHDLPVINASLLELGEKPLSPKLASDTYLDLVKRKDFSASQEALATMYGLNKDKHHMSQTEWREANRLSPSGIKLTKKRVISDVIQHKALRQKLIENKALKPATIWKP